ncbi:MAG: SAM-dependent methyltransferase [Pseudomonadota bacterium]
MNAEGVGDGRGDDLPYDPTARRDTPLALKLKAQIKERGPLPLSDYMHACLYDEVHGYYRGADAIGAGGDFTTSSEISQLFGEIIGIWAAVVWKTMGAPERFNLIELGPGRGTLLADALRAANLVSGFLDAADVALIETNTVLQDRQAATLARDSASVRSLNWYGSLADIWREDKEAALWPTIIVGNEFLDTAPADQFSWTEQGWQKRLVGLDDAGRLGFVTGEITEEAAQATSPGSTDLKARFPSAAQGDMITVPLYDMMDDVVAPWPKFAALFVDYGHETPAIGDTLQAVRRHHFEHPLTSPGEADLTTQVDFAAVVERARGHRDGVEADGPVTQAEFLGRLGILQRTSKLMAMNPDKAPEIEAGVMRLMAPNGMGTRFKVIGFRSADVPTLPGLEPNG